jgi:hypothetical protein
MQGFFSFLGFYCALSALPSLPIHSLFWGRTTMAAADVNHASAGSKSGTRDIPKKDFNATDRKVTQDTPITSTPDHTRHLPTDHPTHLSGHQLLIGQMTLPVDGFANFVCQQAAWACSSLAALNFFRVKVEKSPTQSHDVARVHRAYERRARMACIACGAARKAVEDPAFKSFLQTPAATAGL